MKMRKKFSYKDIVFKSKRLTVAVLVALFGTAALLTSVGGDGEVPLHDGDVLVDSLALSEAKTKETVETGTFAERRAALELERNKLMAPLDKTIENSSSESEKRQAEKEKKRILGYMEKELAIESLIENKKLPECFVLLTESSANVTVDKQELDTNTVAKICDIVMRETGMGADKIIIQSVY